MKNYHLSKKEQTILDTLHVRDAITMNGLKNKLKMSLYSVKETLMCLKAKGLADYTQDRTTMYWTAL